MAYQTIPIRTDLPAYSFQTLLEGVAYTLEFRWNQRGAFWTMDILDEDLNQILGGIRMNAGYLLTEQYANPELPPGEFMLIDSDEANENPTVGDFGTRFTLVYRESTTPEGE